ncbi:hypothetical protein BJ508DRAFT_41434 [Ascobolus immersus RN42]|uniref:F-box domain-containing protein n=1 Tax=Ascobolus immersus RN42 TaxID=1160509 RepID=A0A3N4IDA8_ASCIM|nr:hypothetical protein BJ508DRAFT_41434 [Ascobolus immersus RN42]
MSLANLPLELLGLVLEHLDSMSVLNLSQLNHEFKARIIFLEPVYIKKRISLLRNEKSPDRSTFQVDQLFTECATQPSTFLLERLTQFLLRLTQVVKEFSNPSLHIPPLRKIVHKIRTTLKEPTPHISHLKLVEFLTTLAQENFHVPAELNDHFNNLIVKEHDQHLLTMWTLLQTPIEENLGASLFDRGIHAVDECFSYIIYLSNRFDEEQEEMYIGTDAIYTFADMIVAMWGGEMGKVLSESLTYLDPEHDDFVLVWQNTSYLAGLLTVMSADLMLAVHKTRGDLERIGRMLRNCPPLGTGVGGML